MVLLVFRIFSTAQSLSLFITQWNSWVHLVCLSPSRVTVVRLGLSTTLGVGTVPTVCSSKLVYAESDVCRHKETVRSSRSWPATEQSRWFPFCVTVFDFVSGVFQFFSLPCLVNELSFPLCRHFFKWHIKPFPLFIFQNDNPSSKYYQYD